MAPKAILTPRCLNIYEQSTHFAPFYASPHTHTPSRISYPFHGYTIYRVLQAKSQQSSSNLHAKDIRLKWFAAAAYTHEHANRDLQSSKIHENEMQPVRQRTYF
jgi:hypothetical protein